MSIQISINTAHRTRSRARISVSALAVSALLAASLPAGAAIDNTATANGTPARGTYTPVTDDATVPVAPAAPQVSVGKTVSSVTVANGSNTGATDGGDIITYRYAITNNGNVTLTNVTPVDTGPTFNGSAGQNALTAFVHQPTDPSNTTGVTPASVAPGQTVVFTSTYTLGTLDYLRAAQVDDGIDNSATGDSDQNPTTNTSTATYNIPATPNLQITKVATLTETVGNTTDGFAEVGDTITYTYTVLNTGNVSMTDVAISDDHENGQPGAVVLNSATGTLGTGSGQWEVAEDTGVTPTLGTNSDDGTDGDFDSLAVGGQVVFTYHHTVTQAEFDAQ